MEFLLMVVVAGVLIYLFTDHKKKVYICKECGSKTYAMRKAAGSSFGELCVWIAGLVFAALTSWLILFAPFIYSIWRFVGQKNVCAACESPSIIPIETPLGQQLAAQHGHAKNHPLDTTV